MTLEADRASRYLEDIIGEARTQESGVPEDEMRIEGWLLELANQIVEARLPRQPELNFDILDDTLRSEATRTDVVRSLSDPQRDFLLWEMKQGCMNSVVNCLPPAERAAFLLTHVVRLPDEVAAQTVGINASAYKVRLSRARKKIGDYLAPRCEHVNPMNPCQCPARVGTALRKGFIKPAGELSLRRRESSYGRYGVGAGHEDVPLRDIDTIFANLPTSEPPAGLEQRLLARLDA